MAYLYLAIAIIAEVTATSALKASEEFTRLHPSLIVVIGYAVAFCMALIKLKYARTRLRSVKDSKVFVIVLFATTIKT